MSAPAPTGQQVIVQPTPAFVHYPSLETLGGYAAALIAMATLATLIYNFLTRDLKRDIGDVKREIGDAQHNHKNLRQVVDGLEHLRSQDVERIIKLETNLSNLEKGQVRIEDRLDTMAEESSEARKEIIDSIRELRSVTIKGA